MGGDLLLGHFCRLAGVVLQALAALFRQAAPDAAQRHWHLSSYLSSFALPAENRGWVTQLHLAYVEPLLPFEAAHRFSRGGVLDGGSVLLEGHLVASITHLSHTPQWPGDAGYLEC